MTVRTRTSVVFLALFTAGLTSAILTSGTAQFRPDRWLRGSVGAVQRVFSSVGGAVAGTVQSVGELRRLRADHEALLSEVESYERLEGSIRALERENQLLRAQLGFAARVELDTIAARVIGVETGPVYSSFVINRGERHGVAEDQPIIAFVGGRQGLVGSVREVSGGTALVQPLTAAGSFLSARLDTSRHDGLLEGSRDGSGDLILRYVPRDAAASIEYNALIVTSGLNTFVPPGLPIGRVLSVDAPSYEPTLVIRVEPFVETSRLEYVFIVRSRGASLPQGDL